MRNGKNPGLDATSGLHPVFFFPLLRNLHLCFLQRFRQPLIEKNLLFLFVSLSPQFLQPGRCFIATFLYTAFHVDLALGFHCIQAVCYVPQQGWVYGAE